MVSGSGRGLRVALRVGVVVCVVCGGGVMSVAHAQDGLTWATVGDVNNIAYDGGQFGVNAGRGSVPYAYRITQQEVHTAQWLEFVNTFAPQSDELNDLVRPSRWGGRTEIGYQGPGDRYVLATPFEGRPNPALEPILISWRQAALYCNWLHNGKTDDPASIMSGAYDASTFTQNADFSFNDQLTHDPDARFWIPTLDEYMKAAYYDPAKTIGTDGEPEPGWWNYGHSSDELPVPGPPGVGDSPQGVDADELGVQFTTWLAVGSYPDSQSPWGLLDVLGGEREWIEEPDFSPFTGGLDGRLLKDSSTFSGPDMRDLVWSYSDPDPLASIGSFRIVALVPAPMTAIVVVVGLTPLWRRKR